MAGTLSLQDENLVWQKVAQALRNATPAAQNAFRALKTYMSTQKLCPQLQFIPFTATQISASTGYPVLASGVGANTLYGVYAKQASTATGATGSFVQINDLNTNVTTGAEVRVILRTTAASDEDLAIFPSGNLFTNASGPTVAAVLLPLGSAVTTGAQHAADGFLIVGA